MCRMCCTQKSVCCFVVHFKGQLHTHIFDVGWGFSSRSSPVLNSTCRDVNQEGFIQQEANIHVLISHICDPRLRPLFENGVYCTFKDYEALCWPPLLPAPHLCCCSQTELTALVLSLNVWSWWFWWLSVWRLFKTSILMKWNNSLFELVTHDCYRQHRVYHAVRVEAPCFSFYI